MEVALDRRAARRSGLVMFTWGATLFYQIYEPPGDALEVSVVGKQWMWKIQHSEGRSEINELHVPLGEPVKLTMISQDVIHSFYVPAFRVKQDVLPGRYTSLWFEPTKLGRYHLFCAEYCGTNHSTMGGWVTVMEPADFQSWLSEAGVGPSMAEQGERFSSSTIAPAATAGVKPFRAPARRSLRAAGPDPGRARGAFRHRRRHVYPRFDLEAQGRSRGRLRACDAVVSGPDQRAGPFQDHRLHQVDRCGG